MKVLCAAGPQRASTSSQTVWHVGARRLISMARMPKSRTWIVAPEAYQKGPLTPYCQATFELCKSVAAQVHCETMTEAVRPILTSRPAVLKNSEVNLVPTNLRSKAMIAHVNSEKNAPKPMTMR